MRKRRIAIVTGALAATAGLLVAPTTVMADIIHSDDVIVSFSMCVGNDCVNGESFGFDTLRLKENNLRMHFDDTSTAASFPRNDWRIVANDSSNGGGSYFRIEDSTAGRNVFQIDAGAPSNAIRVDSQGDLGIGIAAPVTDLHIRSGNTPTARLDQDGSSGFTPQVWDVAGNETNFFIRDATNGSTLPFRIRPGAPSSAIDIAADGDVRTARDVGVGLGSSGNPATSDGLEERLLEVKAPTGGDARITIDVDDAAGRFGEVLFERGGTATWSFGMDNSQFYIYNYSTSAYVLTINEATGQVTIPNLAP